MRPHKRYFCSKLTNNSSKAFSKDVSYNKSKFDSNFNNLMSSGNLASKKIDQNTSTKAGTNYSNKDYKDSDPTNPIASLPVPPLDVFNIKIPKAPSVDDYTPIGPNRPDPRDQSWTSPTPEKNRNYTDRTSSHRGLSKLEIYKNDRPRDKIKVRQRLKSD